MRHKKSWSSKRKKALILLVRFGSFFASHSHRDENNCPWLRSKIPLSIILFLQPVQARKGWVFPGKKSTKSNSTILPATKKGKALGYPWKIVMKQLEVSLVCRPVPISTPHRRREKLSDLRRYFQNLPEKLKFSNLDFQMPSCAVLWAPSKIFKAHRCIC